MRIFVAVPLPDGAREWVARVRDRLRTHDWPVRWVGDEALHLTVRFFGAMDQPDVVRLGHVLEQAARGVAPMWLEFGAPNAFPDHRRPRVLWLSVSGPRELELLHERVERTAVEVGFPAERGPYRPHITLGRVRRGARLPAGVPAGLAPPDAGDDTPGCTADRIVLYRSHPGPGGTRYEALRTIPLEGVWVV